MIVVTYNSFKFGNNSLRSNSRRLSKWVERDLRDFEEDKRKGMNSGILGLARFVS